MIFQRTELLIGSENLNKLKNSHVIVFGVGGVGGFATEALVRAGIGEISIVDFDTVDITNLNRQIIALQSTIGKLKTSVMKERLLNINPNLIVHEYPCKFSKDNIDKEYSYIVDAIDLVTCKLDLISIAKDKNIPIISSMGTGNKLNPTMLEVNDINKTSVCPLARVMRKELKNRGIKKLKVVYSEEKPIRPIDDLSISCRTHCICPPGTKRKCTIRRDIPGSNVFVPSTVGLIIASEVVKDLTTI